MAKKIYICGSKGGTGATTFAIGLGRALAEAGERTLIVDGDTRCGCGTIIGGCRDFQVYTLADYEKGGCRAKQTLISRPELSNLLYMPCQGLNDLSYAEKAVAEVDGLFDYILADNIAKKACAGAFIVTEPSAAAIKSADLCRSFLTDGGIRDVSLVVNKSSAGLILNGEAMTAREISALLRMPLAAVIPEDLLLPAGKRKSSTLKAFKTAAENLTGKKEGVYNVLSGFNGVGGFFRRKLRDKV